jgi:hypothetical protein
MKSGYGSSYFFSCSSTVSVSVSTEEGIELSEALDSAEGEYLASALVWMGWGLEDLLRILGRGNWVIVSVMVRRCGGVGSRSRRVFWNTVKGRGYCCGPASVLPYCMLLIVVT